MSNCETCRDKDWCSSEEMDREECPVKPEGDSSNAYVNVGQMFSNVIEILSNRLNTYYCTDEDLQALDVAIKALRFIKHYYPLQFNYYLKEVDDNA